MADPKAPKVVEEAGRLADGKGGCANGFQFAQGAAETATNFRFSDFERPDALKGLDRLVEQRSCSTHFPSEQHGEGSNSAEDEQVCARPRGDASIEQDGGPVRLSRAKRDPGVQEEASPRAASRPYIGVVAGMRLPVSDRDAEIQRLAPQRPFQRTLLVAAPDHVEQGAASGQPMAFPIERA